MGCLTPANYRSACHEPRPHKAPPGLRTGGRCLPKQTQLDPDALAQVRAELPVAIFVDGESATNVLCRQWRKRHTPPTAARDKRADAIGRTPALRRIRTDDLDS
jgi:hypothetical protein